MFKDEDGNVTSSASTGVTGAAKFDTGIAREAAKQLNVLAALVMPAIMAFMFPPHYLYWWKRATSLASGDKGFPKLALGIPRGFAKSTLVKLLICFIILFTKRRFILIICASEDLATAIVRDVIDMLSHKNVRLLFGSWDAQTDYNKASATSFFYRGRKIILKGVGVGTNFRGISENLSRPDVMIFDDAQTRSCALSPTLAKEFQSWFYGTALKCKDPQFCFYLYIGNMYPKLEIYPATEGRPALYGCLLKNLKLNRHWESIVTGAVLSDGSSLWEELHGIDVLLEEYEMDCAAMQEATYLAEVMNFDDAVDARLFDESKLRPYPYPDNSFATGKVMIIDPSLGKANSDNQVVGHVEVIEGATVVRELRTLQMSAPQLVMEVIDWCLETGTAAIAVENYAYQGSLGQWFEYFFGELGITHMKILLIRRGAQSKVAAILSMFKELMDGQLLVHPSALPTLLSEIQVFDPLKKANKDGNLDVAAYANLVVLNFPEDIASVTLMDDAARLMQETGVVDIGMAY